MEIFLLENVRNLGQKHSVVKVPDGYANNNLIPKKLAIPATSQQAKDLLSKQKSKQEGVNKKASGIKEKITELADPLVVSTRTNEHGHLYQAINDRDVFKEIQKAIPNISAKEISIQLESANIKELGEYQATIRISATREEITKKIIVISA